MIIGVGVIEKKKTTTNNASILFQTTSIALLKNNKTKRKKICIPSYSPFFLLIKFSLKPYPLPLPPFIQKNYMII